MANERPTCAAELDDSLQAFIDAVQALIIVTEHAVRQEETTCLRCRDARQAALRVLDKAAILGKSWVRFVRGQRTAL